MTGRASLSFGPVVPDSKYAYCGAGVWVFGPMVLLLLYPPPAAGRGGGCDMYEGTGSLKNVDLERSAFLRRPRQQHR